MQRTFFNQNVDFNILSLNREPGNSAHIIYNKNTENGKRNGTRGEERMAQDGEGRWNGEEE